MKSEKTVDELEQMYAISSSMINLEGYEVVAFLDWDERWYYVWFEPASHEIEFCEENGYTKELEELQKELDDMGVHQFYELEDVNKYLKDYCGDNEPAEFWEGDFGIEGA